jgi:hypothetical protein
MTIPILDVIDIAIAAARRDGPNFRIARRSDGSIYGSYTERRSDYGDQTVADIPVDSWTDAATLRNAIAKAINAAQ